MTPGTPRAFSFDLFDTCLVRAYAAGVDLIADAAARLVPDADDRAERIGEVVRLRMEGEVRATADGRDAAPLRDIYAAVPELAELGVDPEAMHQLEVQLERETLRPVAPTAQRIAALRAAGERIVFISDMHLPAAFLHEVLVRHGLAHADDPLYVSGDLGLSKGTGRLYDHVLAAQGLAPEQLVHRGDDEWTDLRSAGNRGVQVDPFPEGRLNRYERAVVQRAPALPALRGRAAAVSRLVRLQEPRTDEPARLGAALGADVVGPVLSGYVSWLLADARRRGLDRLCFVSRDGQVLHEIAQRLRRPGDPECRYVHGSRLAWYLPGRAADLAWVLEPPHEQTTVRTLLARLALTPADVAADLAAVGLSDDDDVDPDRPGAFGDLLVRLRPRAEQEADVARRLLRAYARQEGMVAGARWALVDVGWSLNAQAALRQVLGEDAPELGYYLALRHGRRGHAEAGPFRALVREDVPDGGKVLDGGWLLRSMNLVEHVFVRADHGQCVGYDERDGQIVPVHRQPRPVPAWFAPLRAAVLRYAEVASATGLLDDGGTVATAAGNEAGRLFALHPSREEARLFGATLVSDDLDEAGLRPMAPPLGARDLVRRLQRSLGLVPDGPQFWGHWEAATWAATAPHVRAAMGLARAAKPTLGRARAGLRAGVRRGRRARAGG